MRLQRLLLLIRRRMIESTIQGGQILGYSDRTIKADIAILRKSGFNIQYVRGIGKYILIEAES